MALDFTNTAKMILEKVGGESNVSSVTHCITRLRFVLKDNKIPKDIEIEKIPGVIRVIKQGGQYQVVIGNDVSNVYKELLKLGNFSDAPSEEQGNSDEGIFSRVSGFIAGSMTPLLPAMLGCGMVSVVLTILSTFGLMDTTGSTYVILSAIGDTFFYFMPIFLGMSVAKKIGSSPVLAMVIGAMLLHPDLINLLGVGGATYFGIPVTSAVYSSSVLPMLLMVPIMKYIEKFADKVSPSMVKVFLKPLIVIFISAPIALIFVAPVGFVLGNFLAEGVNFLYSQVGWLTIMVLSISMPFIIMTGMHYALVPIAFNSLAIFGFDPLLIITMFCANLAQGSASLAVGFRSKNVDTKSTAIASGISAVVAGVTEPALYGVTLKYKTPLIAAMIGAGAAGLYAGITGLVAYTLGGSPSAISLVQMIGGDDMSNFVNGVITLVIAVTVSFIATCILYKEETEDEAPTTKNADIAVDTKPLVNRVELLSPLNGEIVPLENVNDPTFAEKLVGEGIAVIPTEGKVYAPSDATVSVIMDTYHAIGLVTDTGLELLIHVGLETVNLKGKHYNAKVQKGDKVKKGDVLLEFDIDAIKNEGYDIITPVIVVNTSDYVSIKAVDKSTTTHGDVLLTIV